MQLVRPEGICIKSVSVLLHPCSLRYLPLRVTIQELLFQCKRDKIITEPGAQFPVASSGNDYILLAI